MDGSGVMESILVLTHTASGNEVSADNIPALTRGALETVAAGRELAERLGAALTIGIVGRDTANAAATLASTGARILPVTGEAFAQPPSPTTPAASQPIFTTP